MDNVILEDLAGHIQDHCGLECRISRALENPGYAYDEKRSQYDSKRILKHLIETFPPDTLRLIGVTDVDLFVPILKYVYGLAQIEGECALISIYRLRPQFYEQPFNQGILLSRVEKTALHELGHTFGLTHCRDRRCVMHSSTRIKDTDFKHPNFCQTCLELLHWHLKRSKKPLHP